MTELKLHLSVHKPFYNETREKPRYDVFNVSLWNAVAYVTEVKGVKSQLDTHNEFIWVRQSDLAYYGYYKTNELCKQVGVIGKTLVELKTELSYEEAFRILEKKAEKMLVEHENEFNIYYMLEEVKETYPKNGWNNTCGTHLYKALTREEFDSI